MHARSLCWFVLCAAVLLGCSTDEGETPPLRACGERGCSADCEALRGESCDILDEACQQRIFDAVACVRGTEGVLPEIRTLTPEERRAELLAYADADAGVDEQARADAWSAGLQLVGLIDTGSTVEGASLDDQVENVAGYYNSATGSITLIDRGRVEDGEQAQATLAHELVHALQDQEMGLFELYDRTGRSGDALFARSCLVEGEATLYEDLAISLLRGLTVDPGYWDVQLEWRRKYARGRIASSANPYASLWQLTYPVGARFLTDAWLAGGNHAVQSVYWAVPQSTIYWMHGYDAVAASSGQLVRPLACNVAAPPDDYTLEIEENMGSFGLYAFLAIALNRDGVPPTAAAWQDAMAWRQDSLAIFVNAEREVAASWRILFDDEGAAERVTRELSDQPFKVIARGAELEILGAQVAGLLEEWEGTDPARCPERGE